MGYTHTCILILFRLSKHSGNFFSCFTCFECEIACLWLCPITCGLYLCDLKHHFCSKKDIDFFFDHWFVSYEIVGLSLKYVDMRVEGIEL